MQNTFEELWTLIDFISPGYFGTLNDFRFKYENILV
jgi:SNF2 family DNA or RNA helicase